MELVEMGVHWKTKSSLKSLAGKSTLAHQNSLLAPVQFVSEEWTPIDIIYTFEDNTPQGWKVGCMLGDLTHCCKSEFDPFIQPSFGHSSSHSVNFDNCTALGGLHTYGSAQLYDLIGAAVVDLDYWVLTSTLTYVPKVDFYDYETGVLLKHYDDPCGSIDTWEHKIHNAITEVLGKKVCLLFSKGEGAASRYWDDIHFKAS